MGRKSVRVRRKRFSAKPVPPGVYGSANAAPPDTSTQDGTPPATGTYNVYPIIPGGLFDGLSASITNQSATWEVLTTQELNGTFTFYDGGAWWYDKGSTASGQQPYFTYRILDYDGQGSNSDVLTFTVTVE